MKRPTTRKNSLEKIVSLDIENMVSTLPNSAIKKIFLGLNMKILPRVHKKLFTTVGSG